jgi:hypothetical protein
MTEFIRLPKNVTPINYNVELQPNLVDFTFNGKIVIDVNVSLKIKDNVLFYVINLLI